MLISGAYVFYILPANTTFTASHKRVQGKMDKTEAAFRKHYDFPDEGRKLESSALFDSSKQTAGAFHFVFCLDESGSMSGSPWADVTAAYNRLVQRRCSDQCQGDIVSVVTFSSSPRVQAEAVRIESAPTTLSYYGGGTYFAPALQTCDGVIGRRLSSSFTPILIFMSDGCDGASDGPQVMQQLRIKYAAHNLQVHTIAFGHSNNPLLEQMAREGSGQFHTAVDGVQLGQVFGKIAAECTAVDGLVSKFSQILSEMVTCKVMLDYM
jgi:uncharacterized protein YegL